MKKIFVLCLVSVMFLSLVACGTFGGGSDTEVFASTGDLVPSETDGNTRIPVTETDLQETTVAPSDVSTEPEPEPQPTLGGYQGPVTTNTASDSNASDNVQDFTQGEVWKPKNDYPNLVLTSDKIGNRIVVFDAEKALANGGNLDKAVVWEYAGGYSASVKYREDTKYGNVVLYTGNKGATVLTYPDKKIVWSAGESKSGKNPHSIEILPSGNVVVASSTDNKIRIFNTYNCVKKGSSLKYTDYTLTDAHGVLWDPRYSCLWAVGQYELVAYKVVDKSDGTQTLEKIEGKGAKLPTEHGHDLAADLSNDRNLYITTGSAVYVFNKETGVINMNYPQSGRLTHHSVKGFGNNKNNNYFMSYPNGGKGRDWENTAYAEWSTDTIYYGTWSNADYMKLNALVSETSAFYKVRVFYGKYL